MTQTALLLGSYGQSNLGDDLLMWNYLELLHTHGYDTVYTNINDKHLVPDVIRKKYPDLRFIPTYQTSIVDYIRLIKKSDCIVYGGGTLYKELYASTGRSKYSVIIRMMGFNIIARLLRKKLYHLNIGIGSLKTPIGRLISKYALKSATLTILRDHASYRYARTTLGIPARKIAESTDGLFLSDIWKQPWNTSNLDTSKISAKTIVGINVLSDIPDWVDRTRYITTIRKFVQDRLEEGSHVVFIPFQHAFNPRNDAAFMKETFGDILKNHDNYTFPPDGIPIDQISDWLQKCDVFVGMRLHSLILATVSHIPFVAIAYDTKCWRFVQESGYPHAIKLEALTSTLLLETYLQTLASPQETIVRLSAANEKTYSKAGEALRNIAL
jgi:polysaccharide pyruvyl transferase WcaK-like protein